MRFKLSALILALTLSLGACAFKKLEGVRLSEIKGTLPQLSKNESRLFFMRPSKYDLSNELKIKINDKLVMELPLGRCSYYDIAAGTHTIELDKWDAMGSHIISLNLKPKAVYYINVKPKRSAYTTMALFGPLGTVVESAISETKNNGPAEMVIISDDVANELMKDCILFSNPI